MIPQEYIYELVQRNDMVDVAQSYVQLRHRGRTYSGLCPFHSEKTPSFHVYPDTQSFYCFGCGAGGDVITFIKKINNVDYVEAVKILAARAGMPLPEEDDKVGRMRSRITSINKDAARFFFQCLNEEQGKAARRYWVAERGLSAATIRRFGLGYAPDAFHAMRDHLRGLGYSEEEMLASGLVKRSEKGNLYDVFRNRVMVPIFDLRGNVIAFGGRNMGPEKPKYINSPETMVYKKSRTLFALNVAKKSTSKRFILCEGYMDVISMHEAGFDTAVCACGTALTAEQVKLLSEYAEETVLCYDSDEAGQKATERSLHLFENSPVKVTVLSFPGAKDPDEFIRTYGRDRFEMILNGTSNPTEFELGKAKKKYDLRTDDGRLEYIREAIGILAGSGVSPTARDVYAGRIAGETGVAKQAVLSQLEGALRGAARRARRQEQRDLAAQGNGAGIRVPYDRGGDRALAPAKASRQLVAALLQDPDQIPYVRSRLDLETIPEPEIRAAVEAIYTCADQRQPVNATSLQSLLPDEKAYSLVMMVQAQNSGQTLVRQDIDMYLDRLRRGTPKSSQAAKTDDDGFRRLFASIAQDKHAGVAEES